MNTPPPWKAIGEDIYADNNYPLARTFSYPPTFFDPSANTAHIVKCVNMHDELVALIEEVVEAAPRGWSPQDAINLPDRCCSIPTKAKETT